MNLAFLAAIINSHPALQPVQGFDLSDIMAGEAGDGREERARRPETGRRRARRGEDERSPDSEAARASGRDAVARERSVPQRQDHCDVHGGEGGSNDAKRRGGE